MIRDEEIVLSMKALALFQAVAPVFHIRGLAKSPRMSGATCAAQNPTGTVLTPRPMHKVVWSDLISRVRPSGGGPFSCYRGTILPLHQIASTKSDRAIHCSFMITHLPPARLPVLLPKKKPPFARLHARPPAVATNFHSLNPFIGTPLPKVQSWPSK